MDWKRKVYHLHRKYTNKGTDCGSDDILTSTYDLLSVVQQLEEILLQAKNRKELIYSESGISFTTETFNSACKYWIEVTEEE